MTEPARNHDSTADLLGAVRQSHHARVQVGVTDIDGIVRGKYLSKDKFLSAADQGFGFCNVVLGWDSNDVCYDECTYTGWHSGYPDAQVKLDLATSRTLPWDEQVPFFLGSFVEADGSPLPICPRQTLIRVLDKAKSMGLSLLAGCEFEWFNFKESPADLESRGYQSPKPLSSGMFGYSLVRIAQQQGFFRALMEELKDFRVPLEGLHTETGPGVLEAAITYSDALEAADRAVLFKLGAKAIAQRFGILPTFMAKWNATLPGSSGHVHQSVWDADLKNNLFYDANGRHGMSALFESYVAGQLLLLPDLLPFYAPTVNSYKRLVDGFWAPTKPTWAVDNRTVALRVLPLGKKSTRVEVRVPGADCNPYLALAASFASGLYGIEKGLKLDQLPIHGSGYAADVPRFSRTLGESTEKLASSAIAPEILGEKLVRHFVESRRSEWKRFGESVTNWELARYLEVI